MDLAIKDKVALVLASTDGLGSAIAAALAAEGARVVVHGRDTPQLDVLARTIGPIPAADSASKARGASTSIRGARASTSATTGTGNDRS
jgi:NAD(P)-dependent dehydrogenase (short-subunit alcohol dehydrogenase family)